MAIHSFTGADDGSKQAAAVGDVLSIALESNSGTGFDWTFAGLDERMFAMSDEGFLPGGPGIGASGMRRFRIDVRRPGRGAICLVYKRSWEGDGSIRKSFSLDVEVAESR